MIVICDENGGIAAADGSIPFSNKQDLKFFKRQTLNNVVVMGFRTFESLGKKPLPNRINVVLTRHQQSFDCHMCNVVFINSFESCIRFLNARYPNKKWFLIGGAEIYNQALDKKLIHTIYMTTAIAETNDAAPVPIRINTNATQLQSDSDWECCSLNRDDKEFIILMNQHHTDEKPYTYTFNIFTKRNK